jgi:protoporphyrinogen oxidase
MKKHEVVILGGGAAALGSAYHLAQNGISPLIVEKSPYIGGLAGSYQIDGYTIEKFYHHFFPTDYLVFQLAKGLSIEDKLIWRKAPMGFYYQHNLYGFTTPLDILRFSPLSVAGRIRFGLTMLKIGREKEFGRLDGKNAKEWLLGEFGEETYRKIFEPLLKIKFAMSLDKASAAFVHGRLHARSESRIKNPNTEKLGYMEGGYNQLLESMIEKIRHKSTILTKAEIKEVRYNRKTEDFSIVILKNRKTSTITATHVINTLALEIFSKLAKGFPLPLMKSIGSITYQAVICATIGLKKQLSDYYWINISSSNLPFHGVIEHTNFIPKKKYGNTTIAYLFNYVSPKDALWTMKEEDIKKLYIDGLCTMFPHLSAQDVIWFKLAKERYATPIFLQGYEKKMKSIDSFGNLHFAGSFKIYPHSRNVNNVIKTGIDAAKRVISSHTTEHKH